MARQKGTEPRPGRSNRTGQTVYGGKRKSSQSKSERVANVSDQVKPPPPPKDKKQ